MVWSVETRADMGLRGDNHEEVRKVTMVACFGRCFDSIWCYMPVLRCGAAGCVWIRPGLEIAPVMPGRSWAPVFCASYNIR
jgi:hypothetical protein